LGHVFAHSIKDNSQVTIQCKYLALAAKLLTSVRASVISGSEESLEWADHIKDIVENKLLNQINEDLYRIKGAKEHEQMRILKEVMLEWYNIVQYYQSTSTNINKFEANESFVKQ
jgi:hypothetical protein